MNAKIGKKQGGSDLNAASTLTFTDAAWMVGMTPEAFEHLAQSGGADFTEDASGEKFISLADILRLGFSMTAQKEAQVAMLRTQLSTALEREKELAAQLQEKLDFDGSEQPALAGGGKKKKKKKKK